MAKKVNLDAFIPREDFEIREDSKDSVINNTFSLTDLNKGAFFFSSLRKPDFQRETNEWDAKKIYDLIASFVNGDLIPAIILWKNASGYTFVIDGSHRISALVAWINDDYGDGEISKLFYNGIVPEEQIKLAEQTRAIIRKEIGSYADFKLALSYPEKVRPEIVERAKHLGTIAIQAQWVKGDAQKAEQSYFKINREAVPIDGTELRLLESREMPNCIAARALIRSGTGHKYWSKFPLPIQKEIETLAKEINDILFQPRFKTPIRTLDVSIGGKAASAQSLSLVLEFINIVNNVGSKNRLNTDQDGINTIDYLKKCKKIALRINSNNPSSLGLHPIVYFYSQDGRYKVASFFAIVALILDFEESNSFKDFTSIRKEFEEIILKYDFFNQQIVRRYRSAVNAYTYVKNFYLKIIEKLLKKQSSEQTIQEILQDANFKYLKIPTERSQTEHEDFSGGTKSAAFITKALSVALKCEICQGYLHTNAISFDHITRKEEGGLGTFDNAQLTHPYCNSTVKN